MVHIKRLAIVLIVIILALTTAGYFTVNYVFDKMIGGQILDQIQLDNLEDGALGRDTGEDWERDKDLGEDSNRSPSVSRADGLDSREGEEEGRDRGQTSPPSQPGQEQKFSQEDLREIQNSFSTVDKLRVMNMLSSKLSASEIRTLTSMASGGVNQAELNRIKSTLKDKLDDKDIQYLKGLYSKYE